MDTVAMTKWLNKELSSLLECEVGDEYSKNILKIETETELREFIGSLLDLDEDKNKRFYKELSTKLNKSARSAQSTMPDVIVYRKPDLEEPVAKNKGKKNHKDQDQEAKLVKKEPIVLNPLAPGTRQTCQCQAAKHKLVANCLKCGRIVCEIEGSGPCYFCGNLVCTKEEFDKIRSGSNKGMKLRDELMSKPWRGSEAGVDIKDLQGTGEDRFDMSQLEKAIAHKDKLLDYDRTSAKRTQVIDDESDYFNTNSKWLNQEQRSKLEKKQEEIREKRFGSKIGKTFTLDFAGRKVIDEQKTIDLKDYANQIDDIMTDKKPMSQANTVVNQDIKCIAPVYIEEKPTKKKLHMPTESNKENSTFRLQDQNLQEMKDEGMCLSMHQPWASLLVMGIKQHEGRSWYTPYRGRLWIHAGSKQPDEVDIKELESFYKIYYSNHNLKFPDSYPTSCLLGYVDLKDCMSADIYKEEFPNGESESEFVFICKNFRELFSKIPMSGQHKIFKLDKGVHSVAKKTSVIYHDDDE